MIAASTKGSDRPRGGVIAPARGGGRALPGGAAGRDMGAGWARRIRSVSGQRTVTTRAALQPVRTLITHPHPAGPPLL